MKRPIVVVGGPSGSGKTAIGRALAAMLEVPFLDADDLHPPDNVAKMARGQALDDESRKPWLAAVAGRLSVAARHDGGLVIACSALKAKYRTQLRQAAPATLFIMLDVPPVVLRQRLTQRVGHFMPPSLVDSQLADYEPLGDEEPGHTIDASGELSQSVALAMTVVRSTPPSEG